MKNSRRQFLASSAAAGSWMLLGGSSYGLFRQQAGGRAWPKDNPFLLGNYGPVHEEVTGTELEVIGELPEGLDGMFVRNGPNPQFPPVGNYHWFDGDGMLHGTRIRDGKASYRNRYIRSDGWNAERKHERAIYGGLMDPPSVTRPPKGAPRGKNTGNTAVVFHDKKLLALMEGGLPYEVAVPDLETVGLYHYEGKLRHSFTAHPKIDPTTGEMMFFGYGNRKPYVQYKVVDADGKITHSAEVDIPQPVMMHDFAITENYSVFMDLPQVFSMERARSGQPPYAFEPDRGARIGLLGRHDKGGLIRWFEIEPCFVFHVLGAWEDGDEVVLIAGRYQRFPRSISFSGRQTAMFTGQGSGDPDSAYLYQWRFNLDDGSVTEEQLDDRALEFPRINDDLCGQPAAVGYAMSGDMGGFLRYDLEAGEQQAHSHGPGRLGGEGVFVPHPDGDSEEHGWLVTYVFDAKEQKSEFVVVDCEDFTGPPVARVKLPARVPFGFHGTWIPGDQI